MTSKHLNSVCLLTYFVLQHRQEVTPVFLLLQCSGTSVPRLLFIFSDQRLLSPSVKPISSFILFSCVVCCDTVYCVVCRDTVLCVVRLCCVL